MVLAKWLSLPKGEPEATPEAHSLPHGEPFVNFPTIVQGLARSLRGEKVRGDIPGYRKLVVLLAIKGFDTPALTYFGSHRKHHAP